MEIVYEKPKSVELGTLQCGKTFFLGSEHYILLNFPQGGNSAEVYNLKSETSYRLNRNTVITPTKIEKIVFSSFDGI